MLRDRRHGAYLLYEKLCGYKKGNAVVVAVPRGGVPVGFHLATLLGLQLEIIPCKRMKHPANEHRTVGFVTIDVVNLVRENLDIPQDYIGHQITMLQRSACSQYRFYRNCSQPVPLNDKTVILVDDLLQTEHQMIALLQGIRKQKPGRMIVAVPVATSKAAQRVATEADEFIGLYIVSRTDALSAFYEFLPPVSDDAIREMYLTASSSFENLFSAASLRI